ncbi:MAG: C4-type zinc ribbon domain-containing protein [Thermodesulfobacteriota bacterium]|nr:C4-type zinc ribbon domain-containing protein [Thermodesulfobacteriota bacterium]
MPDITSEDINMLVRLQENDNRRRKLKSFLAGVPEKLAALDAALTEAENRFREQEETIARQKKTYRDYEGEVQAKQERIKQRDTQLFSIKNNKEYQAVLKEMDELKRECSRLEDEMLALLDALEEGDAVVASARQAWEVEQVRIEQEKAAVEKERAVLADELSDLDGQWEEMTNRLPGSLLNRFLEVRQRVNNGKAIVAVRNYVCQGCFMNIPAQMYNDLHKADALKNCPFCNRMIYFRQEADVVGG